MKKNITIEATVCDICTESDSHASYQCIKCGKDYCYKCSINHLVVYCCGVSHSGSDDGYYCRACDEELNWALKGLSQDSVDPLYYAYLRIRRLRKERENFYTDMDKRTREAEEDLQMYRTQWEEERKTH